MKLLASRSVRNIDQYNRLYENGTPSLFEDSGGRGALPYILIIIDELADLMMLDKANVEEAITRLAQMARAVGIRLILATQRPSVDVITGLIKANVPDADGRFGWQRKWTRGRFLIRTAQRCSWAAATCSSCLREHRGCSGCMHHSSLKKRPRRLSDFWKKQGQAGCSRASSKLQRTTKAATSKAPPKTARGKRRVV